MAAISQKITKPRGPGKKFTKGQSGNPVGRPKRTQEELDLIAACKQKTPAALEVIENIMAHGEKENNRLAAAQIIIERAYGKPVQPNELSGKGGGPVLVEMVIVDAAG